MAATWAGERKQPFTWPGEYLVRIFAGPDLTEQATERAVRVADSPLVDQRDRDGGGIQDPEQLVSAKCGDRPPRAAHRPTVKEGL